MSSDLSLFNMASSSTSQTPTRQVPMRAAKARVGSDPEPPVTPLPGGRVTRSSGATLPATPSPGSKRAAAPDDSPNKRSTRQRNKIVYTEDSDENAGHDGQSDSDASHVFVDKIDSDDEPLLSPAMKFRSKAKASSLKAKRIPAKAKSSPAKSKKVGTGKIIKKSKGRKAAASYTPTKTSSKRNKTVLQHPPQPNTRPAVIPPWNTLPYLVLVRIFEYAAGTSTTVENPAKWLLDTSLICRAFTEPALTALYRAPPILTLRMAHGLVKLLSKSPDETIFRYRQKVKFLELEVGTVVAKSFRGQHLDFRGLLGNTPRLSEVYLYHDKDDEPYRNLYDNIKWSYPADMFLALGVKVTAGAQPGDLSLLPVEDTSSVPTLQGWMWNRRMLGDFPLHKLKEIHQFPAFKGLRKLVFTNFQLAAVNAKNPEHADVVNSDLQLMNDLVQSISVLPQLKHLVVNCSTVANGQFLSLLPKSIEHLELICCWEVYADQFAEYLVTHGNALRHLTLHHNQSLSLGFLPVLASACPRLESLRMNMSYFSSLWMYKTAEPGYDALLTADQVPTWPTTLRYVQLLNLSQWDQAAAETFFQSLLDSAPNLPALRHLEIKAMLSISIRERAKLRDGLVSKLKRCFLAPWVDPLPSFSLRPHLGLLEAGPSQELNASPSKKKRDRNAKRTGSPTRRSGRIAILPSDQSSRASSTGRDTRAQGTRGMYTEVDSDVDIVSPSEDSAETPEQSQQDSASATAEETPFIQGLCTKVDVRVDNEKPVENQFTYDDFMDDSSQAMTDEDWSEGAEFGPGWDD